MKPLLNYLGRFIAGVLLLIFFWTCLSSCQNFRENRRITREILATNRAIVAQIGKLDSIYRHNQTILIKYEKDNAKAKFGTMPSDSLLRYIRSNR